jgi:hypothetical protein
MAKNKPRSQSEDKFRALALKADEDLMAFCRSFSPSPVRFFENV